MKTFITAIDGTKREVKNLGWLVRHADDVSTITLSDRDDGARCGCKLVADLFDGTKYTTAFNSQTVAHKWLSSRRSMRHVLVNNHITAVTP